MKEKSHRTYPPFYNFIWTAAVFAFCIAIIISGEFHCGGPRGPIIRPDTHPYLFWGFITFWFSMGVVVAYYGYKEYRNYLLIRKAEKRLEQEALSTRTSPPATR